MIKQGIEGEGVYKNRRRTQNRQDKGRTLEKKVKKKENVDQEYDEHKE